MRRNQIDDLIATYQPQIAAFQAGQLDLNGRYSHMAQGDVVDWIVVSDIEDDTSNYLYDIYVYAKEGQTIWEKRVGGEWQLADKEPEKWPLDTTLL